MAKQLILGLMLAAATLPQNTVLPKTTILPKTTMITPAGGGSGPTYVQGCATYTPGGTATVTCTFASAITSANQLYLCVINSSSISSPVWSGDSGTFTADPGNGSPITNTVANGEFLSCVYVPANGGGNTAITLTATGLAYPVITGVEVHGGVFDQSDATMTTSVSAGASCPSNNIAPTANHSLLLGWATGTTSFTAGTNVAWTLPAAAYSVGIGIEYFSQTTAVSVNAQIIQGTTGGCAVHIVDFKP